MHFDYDTGTNPNVSLFTSASKHVSYREITIPTVFFKDTQVLI